MSFYDRALPEGHSGFFTPPSHQLDPSLFDGDRLKPEVRMWLLGMLADGLARYLDLKGSDSWLHVWLAGSGITYQWSGDRGNGDLDVLFGVDMAAFTRLNPQYTGLPESYVADHADQVLKQKLWPATADAHFGSQSYEVTFFWSPGTGSDITKIHPYAAYDLQHDAWVVRPPELPADPRSLYAPEWYDAARRDVDAAETIASRYLSLQDQLRSTALGSPQAANALAEMQRTQDAATALFTEIHGGRREAFGEQGHGYGDWHNYRWQSAKETGVVGGLSVITREARAQREATEKFLYGGPIDGPETIITRDIMRYGKTP